MLRRVILTALILTSSLVAAGALSPGRACASSPGQPSDWQRFYYYPYVYYPQTFQRPQGSFDHLYYRYPQERRIPVYNKNWHNFYPDPEHRKYYSGHHFILDVF